MQSLDTFVAAAVNQTKEQFVKQFPHPFLLLKLDEAPVVADEWSFQTRMMVSRKSDGTPAMLNESATLYRLFPLIKLPNNPWPERISVGRARNNDVVLPDNSVSKLHCHYTWDSKGGHFFADIGSRNGTFLNTVRLKGTLPTPVKINDQIVFGSVQTIFISPNQLFSLVQAQLQK